MPSIILSFVGKQDPFSENHTEGSIVSLVKHLVQQQQPIKRILLLHTTDTASGAADTQTWLTTELHLSPDRIQLIPVDAALSNDPVNLLLAAQAARSGIDHAQPYLDPSDTLEFNASSGTPVMKSAWSILQAAGYAPRSHVWQVRNPQEMRSHQDRVFQTDVTPLKDEFDLKVIQQQIQDYNYSGALITLQQSNLQSPAIAALLDYGYYRLSMDFDKAYAAIHGLPDIDPIWIQEIAPLRQKAPTRARVQEAYFNALIRLHTRKYADFLVLLFKLQEQLLDYLIQSRLGFAISRKPHEQTQSWTVIRQVDQGKLYQFLQAYRLPKGDPLYLDRSISRYVLQAIVEYHPQFHTILPQIQALNQYCELRNESVHEFVGVSSIDNEAYLLTTLRKLMQQACGIPTTNPFDRLNHSLRDRLTNS